MNWEHFKAFVWLRWRLMANQVRRAGKFNAWVTGIVVVGAIVMAVPLFVGCFVAGVYLIPKAEPLYLLLAWDALLFFFLLFWGVGLIAELQRNDPLSLSKFLHMPVSPNGAFVINYLSSLMRLSLMIFGPMMLAFALSLIYVKGVTLLPVLFLLGAFLLMVTALTYQFQGWLAALMSNPRRRRSIVVGLTMAFVLFFQLPNLLNVYAPWSGGDASRARNQKFSQELATLGSDQMQIQAQLNAKTIDVAEYQRKMQEISARQQQAIEQNKREAEQAGRETREYLTKMATLVNAVLPVGWLPLGVMGSAEGWFVPPLLGFLGMSSIGVASLAMAYRTTLNQFRGGASNAGVVAPKPAAVADPGVAKPVASGERRTILLEAKIPGLSEPVAGIALAGLRSILRAPEAKMALLSPIISCGFLGVVLVKNGDKIPEMFRPLAAMGGIIFLLMGLLQLTANQFGIDRDGFRVFVLSAASRRDILMGKNLSVAPLALLMGAMLLAVIEVLSPLRWDHLLAMLPLMTSMYLLFCLFTNLASIYTPVYMTPGSLKATSPKATTVLLQVVMFLLVFPICQAPAFLPLGAEYLSQFLGWTEKTPVCLILAVVECALVVLLYRLIVSWQGSELQQREQKILETVTNKAA